MKKKSKLKVKSVLLSDFTIRQSTVYDGIRKLRDNAQTAMTFLSRYEKYRFVSWNEGLFVKIGYER